ncbi:DUF4040 domain-containing protein [Halosimplex amylolyticum]|uniref:DUF4040 domain-containing protein n=1 Tax=Halosimplex amylolyticum TaxID=3396616 RepID=UPI003F562858
MTPDPTSLAVVLLAFVLVAGATVALARNLYVLTVAFGAYSLGLALLWIVYRAPDVALTEAVVGAGVTTALFLAAASRTDPSPAERAFDARPGGRGLLVGAAVVVVLGSTVPALPRTGDPRAPAFGPDGAAAFYLAETGGLGIDNVVTAVLVVFRGFDTFGEVAVVFAAGVAVVSVLRGGESA